MCTQQKIVITTTSFGQHGDTLALCKDKGFEIVLNPYKRKVQPEELVSLAQGAVGIVAGTEEISEEVLLRLPKLRVISRCGVGMDSVDIDAAHRLGIKVYNTPEGPTLAVAELTIGLTLNLLKMVNQADGDLKKGLWDKRMGNLLFGKRVGILGFGRIGQKSGELFRAFGVELAYCDLEEKSCSISCTRKGIADLLKWVDILVLHLSAAPESKYLIGIEELKMMKKGNWLVNVSRGGVVDEKALVNSLAEGYLAGAALDVFEREPYKGPLGELDNVILTPHIGSYAVEARVEMEKQAVANLLAGLRASARNKYTN